MTTVFEVGKTYRRKYSYDGDDYEIVIKVVSRTPKTITVVETDNAETKYRFKPQIIHETEWIKHRKWMCGVYAKEVIE